MAPLAPGEAMRSSRRRRDRWFLFGALALVALLLAPSPATAAHPTCFGRDATVAPAGKNRVVAGTAGDDVIIGTGRKDRIRGGGGDDTICGGGGNDRIDAGAGADDIKGGRGNDRLKGGQGDDLVLAGKGRDRLDGGEGDDLLRGQGGRDKGRGGAGSDICKTEKRRDCEADPKTTLVTGMTFAVPLPGPTGDIGTNPAVSTAGSVHAYWEIMYNGLIALDANGRPVPQLAREVPTVANGGIGDGGRTYTFRLQHGVQWHDGAPFTAADVKFSFEKALLPFHGRTRNMASALESWDPVGRVASIDVLDDHTVRFRFREPYAPLLQQLNVTEAPIIPAHLYTGNPTLNQLKANTVGTGPMRFAEGTAAQARVVRNPSYFRAPLPNLEEIVMRPLVDEQARFDALVSGAVDFIWDVPDSNRRFIDTLRADPAFRTEATQSLGGGANSIDQLIFNLTASGDTRGQVDRPNPTGTPPDPHPILGGMDPQSSGAKVRRAIAHAIDRTAYLNARAGIGTVATAPISSELPFHATDISLPELNRVRANQLLEEAGWVAPAGVMSGSNPRVALNHPNETHANPALRVPDGTPLRLRMAPPSPIFNARIAELKSQLGTVGIDMVFPAGTVVPNRDFDTSIINFAQGYDPHIGVRRQYHSDQVTTLAATNLAGYKNALVDNAFDQAVKTIDFNERFRLYHQFQEQVARDLPYVWLIETPNVRAFTARCSRFKVFTGLFAEGAYCRTSAGAARRKRARGR